MQTSAQPNAGSAPPANQLEQFWLTEAEALLSLSLGSLTKAAPSESAIRLTKAPGPLTWYVESDRCHGVDQRYWVLECCDGPKYQYRERPGLYHGLSTRFDDAGHEWVRYYLGFMDDFGNLVEVHES